MISNKLDSVISSSNDESFQLGRIGLGEANILIKLRTPSVKVFKTMDPHLFMQIFTFL